MLRIGSIVLRVDDVRRQTEFWQAALGYVRRDDGASDDFVLLGPPDGVGPHVSLDQVRSALQIPPRVHLDLYTDDQAREVKRLIALGATERTRIPPTTPATQRRTCSLGNAAVCAPPSAPMRGSIAAKPIRDEPTTIKRCADDIACASVLTPEEPTCRAVQPVLPIRLPNRENLTELARPETA